MNFLTICQTVRQEVGVSGTGPTTVVSQEGQLKVIVDAVANASFQIQVLWHDWDFLWSQYSSTTSIGTRAPALQKPTDLNIWDRNSFYLDYTSNTNYPLNVLDYASYLTSYRQGVATNSTPTYVVIQPDQNIILEPPPDAVHTITADYWKTPAALTANTDIPDIPAQYHRAVVARAKTMWAEREEAPEILLSASAEYQDLLDKLESHSLSGQEGRRMAGGTTSGSSLSAVGPE